MSARLAQRWGAQVVLMVAIVGLTIFGLVFGSLFVSGSFALILIATVSGMALAGLSYGLPAVGYYLCAVIIVSAIALQLLTTVKDAATYDGTEHAHPEK